MKTLNPSDVSNTDPETWPVAHTIDNASLGYSFSVNQTTQAACQTADRKDPESITMRVTDVCAQMWNEFMWFALGMDIWASRQPYAGN